MMVAPAEVIRVTHDHPDFQTLITELDREFWVRYPDVQQHFEPFNKIDGSARVVLAYVATTAVGCGCFRPMNGAPRAAEIKRMYVKPDFRNRGIARKVLQELECWAVEEGFDEAKLETGLRQPEAIATYRKSGYEQIPNFEPYVGVDISICMRKQLVNC
ncbi:MAG: GNAT family N-acetyltransferase [Bacteroidota bacterium]